MADHFSKNVSLWKSFNPDWASFLEKITCTFVFFENNPDGTQNLNVQIDGKKHFFYPQEDIQKKEEEWLKKINLVASDVIFIYGIGLGYNYEALKNWLHADSKRRLVFFEDNLEVIHRFFETVLATEFLQDKQIRLEFITWPCLPEDPTLKENSIAYCFEQYQIVPSNFYQQVRYDRFIHLKDVLSNLLLNYHKFTFEMFNSNRVYFSNFINNLLLLPTSYLASSLKDKFSDVPAIICGAGPSLNKNIDVLKTLSDRALIFGPGTSMNALNSLGITPHFGVGVDPNPSQFDRIAANNAFEVPFFYRNRLYPEALQLVQADRLFISGSGVYTFPQWFEEQLGIETLVLDEGYNVINFSISVARMLGCNPIIFVGVDLAYTDNKSYASNLKEHALSHSANTFTTKSHSDELIVQNDIYGRPVYTLEKWKNESSWIGWFAKSYPNSQLINATEGGLGFPGVPNQTLAEVAEKLLKNTYDFIPKIHEEIEKSKMPSLITSDKVTEVMTTFKSSLERCQKIYLQLIKEYEDKETSFGRIKDYKEELDVQIASKYFLSDVKKTLEGYLRIKAKLMQQATVVKERELIIYRFLEQFVAVALSAFPEHKFADVEKLDFPKIPDIEGSSCLYYASGALKRRLLPDGTQEYFYANGILKTILPYKDRKLDGRVLMFYPNGNKKRELHFKEGKRHGYERLWSEIGQLLIEAEYKDDKPIHKASAWYKNGLLKMNILYDEEGVEKEMEEWDPSGIKIAEKKLDYFDQLILTTKNLALSIDLCYAKIEEILKGDNSEFIELKKNLALLKESNQKIQATFSKENFKEPIWKSEAFQKQIHHQIGDMIKKMVLEVNTIYQTIEMLIGKHREQL